MKELTESELEEIARQVKEGYVEGRADGERRIFWRIEVSVF